LKYSHKVKIESVDFDDVKLAFHQYSFISFLTKLQPVKILSWDGIESGKKAKFKFWFFGWKYLTVCHEKYINTNSRLSFYDKGVDLPMGIKFWSHFHAVRKSEGLVYIEDLFEYRHENKIIEKILYPIMIAPIIVRKITYKLYFW
tara:strand:- start:197 stop:631 length:435 start_codon:yes stop_codon:yes gene_type:complete